MSSLYLELPIGLHLTAHGLRADIRFLSSPLVHGMAVPEELAALSVYSP